MDDLLESLKKFVNDIKTASRGEAEQQEKKKGDLEEKSDPEKSASNLVECNDVGEKQSNLEDSDVDDVEEEQSDLEEEDDLEETSDLEWSDELFQSKFMQEHKFPKRVTVTESIERCKAFLNWYVSGKGGKVVMDLWIDVVSGIYLPSPLIPFERLTASDLYVNDYQHETAGAGSSYERRFDKVSKLTDYIYKSEGTNFDSSEAKNWYSYIFEKLKLKRNSMLDPAVFSAINYLGFIALNLLRILIRDDTKVSHHITKNLTNDFNSIWGEKTIRLPTPPPHTYAMKHCRNLFQKTTTPSNKALTIILATYISSDSSNQKLVRSILQKACLDDLKYHGMGCYYWLKEAETASKVPANVIVDCMTQEEYRPVNECLRRILEYYLNPTSCSHTWPWSRLLIDKIFLEISLTKNPQYAAVLAAITCNRDPKSTVWNIKQFSDAEIKRKALQLSMSVLKQMHMKQEDT